MNKNAYKVKIRGVFPYHGQVVETRREEAIVVTDGGIEKAIAIAKKHYDEAQTLEILSVDNLGLAIIK